MLQGKEIICFANDWDGDPLSKKHIMKRLAQRNRILWVNSIGNRSPKINKKDLGRIFRKANQFFQGVREVEKNIYVFSPVMIPFYHSMAFRKANQLLLAAMIRRQLKRLGFSKPITWTFAPSSADVVGWLGESQVIYHCVDEFSAFSDAPQTAIQKMEETLLKKSDMVIVSASTLQESKRRWNPNTHLVRHGVEYDLDWSYDGRPFLTKKGDLVDVLRRAIKTVTGVDAELSTTGGTSDGRFIVDVCPQVVEFGPVNATIHKVNECIALEDLETLPRIYGKVLEYLLLK